VGVAAGAAVVTVGAVVEVVVFGILKDLWLIVSLFVFDPPEAAAMPMRRMMSGYRPPTMTALNRLPPRQER
jgi:hypothetical protein